MKAASFILKSRKEQYQPIEEIEAKWGYENKRRKKNMIDFEKIAQYMTTMGLNMNGGFQLSTFAINEMLGHHYSISEKDLHDGVEWLKAKMKKEVEENPYWTTEQKEDMKNRQEYFLNCFEHDAKIYLKKQNRLLRV